MYKRKYKKYIDIYKINMEKLVFTNTLLCFISRSRQWSKKLDQLGIFLKQF